MEGIMGGGEMAAIVNQMIMDLAPAIFDEIKEPLVKAVLVKFIELANSLLQGMTFQDLIDIILGNKLLSWSFILEFTFKTLYLRTWLHRSYLNFVNKKLK